MDASVPVRDKPVQIDLQLGVYASVAKIKFPDGKKPGYFYKASPTPEQIKRIQPGSIINIGNGCYRISETEYKNRMIKALFWPYTVKKKPGDLFYIENICIETGRCLSTLRNWAAKNGFKITGSGPRAAVDSECRDFLLEKSKSSKSRVHEKSSLKGIDLKAARESLNMTQSDFASEIGVGPWIISKLECGREVRSSYVELINEFLESKHQKPKPKRRSFPSSVKVPEPQKGFSPGLPAVEKSVPLPNPKEMIKSLLLDMDPGDSILVSDNVNLYLRVAEENRVPIFHQVMGEGVRIWVVDESE